MWPHLITPNLLARELKRGSTELLILALVEDRPRHGYEIARKRSAERPLGRIKTRFPSRD